MYWNHFISQAGVASWGTDEGKFIRIFTQRSRPQLAATYPEYKKVIIFAMFIPLSPKPVKSVGQQSTSAQ